MPTGSSPDLANAVVLCEQMVASGCDDPMLRRCLAPSFEETPSR
jgi:hypothetical protein